LISFVVAPDAGVSARVLQLASLLARYFAVFHAEAAVATTSHAVYVLVSRDGAHAAARLAEGAATSLPDAVAKHLTVAVSDVSEDPDDLPTLRRAVDDVVRAAEHGPSKGRVFTFADVRAEVLFEHIGALVNSIPDLRHPGINDMLSADNRQRTDFAGSVLAWMDAAGDIPRAATSLGIHPNTLRYRLGRVKALYDLDLEDPDVRLAVWLSLRIDRRSPPRHDLSA
jgi:DNA-binding PucR family transcriptional regulator